MKQQLSIPVDSAHSVSALLEIPDDPRAGYVFAHGAGAGMQHPFMASVAARLAREGIATLRYQFPYMERGSRRPDPAPLCHATVRAAVAAAHRRLPSISLFAGGKSFGGRMTSQAQAISPLPHVLGLIFLGFPLHPAGKPSARRGEHLAKVELPMLFVQGDRDTLADRALLETSAASLGKRATVEWITGGDHSFHVLKRSGRTDEEALDEIIRAITRWIDAARA